ncbi:DUF5685 family protein [Kitasatospora sp. NBC_00374]|uniref:DUF5685 family protein n=1 Tax=Kitasatospora sp. NBC_00374 TaxID=2975964 RepID=UPI0030DFD967
MFGIIRPCRHRLSERLRTSWLAHLCGLCLALRDDHGQLARTATNYDGLIISVLVEAQRETIPGQSGSPAGRRKAGPCPLRGMRSAEVADGEGARLAAAVSLALASVKMRDHVQDGDGAFAHRPVAAGARAVARRWDRQSAGSGSTVGFDTGVLLTAAARQGQLEQDVVAGSSVLLVTEPTETATAAAFAHTAVLAGRPANATALAEAGRLFGRLAHLLDAAEDQAQDAASGAWNPLTATGTERAEAERLCRDAVHGIRLALKDAEFTDRALAHLLLAHETGNAVDRVFGHGAGCALPELAADGQRADGQRADGHRANGHRADVHRAEGSIIDRPPTEEPPRKSPRGALAGCAVWALMACTCQLTCCEHDDPFSRERREGWCQRNCDCICDSCNCGCDGCTACDGCECDCCCPCDC